MASNKYDNQGATKPGTKIIYCKRDLKKLYNGSILCYTDKDGKNKYTNFELPQKDGYIFKGYYTEKNGKGKKIIGENGGINFNWNGDTLYAYWEPYKVLISYSLGYYGYGGSLAKNHGKSIYLSKPSNKSDYDFIYIYTKDTKGKNSSYEATPPVHQWSDNYFVYVDSKEVFNVIDYGKSLDKSGLYNYNNPNSINLTNNNAIIKKGEEWNTEVNGTGKSYDQSKVYKASDFCVPGKNHCIVTLYANWRLKVTKLTLPYSSYGVVLGDEFIFRVNVESKATGFARYINPGITWKISDPKVLEILDSDPKEKAYGQIKLKSKKKGKAKITATSANGKSITVNVEVFDRYVSYKVS